MTPYFFVLFGLLDLARALARGVLVAAGFGHELLLGRLLEHVEERRPRRVGLVADFLYLPF